MSNAWQTKESPSDTEPDWSRERPRKFWDPARKLLKSIRDYQRWNRSGKPFKKVLMNTAVLRHRFWSTITSADIPLNCQIGGGLLLLHPCGVVIHPEAKIGCNCLIFQQVTLVEGVELGGHVDIGAGAKIIKPVRIGSHAKIGANAVVLEDVPTCATAIGIPAKVIEQSGAQALF